MVNIVNFMLALIGAFISYFIAITILSISGVVEFSANAVAIALALMVLVEALYNARED